jgi:16S rRNA processing protein RimM
MPAADRLILVGRVAGAFGVKGELRLTAYTADPLALLAYKTLKGEDGAPVLTLTAARPGKPSTGGAAEVVARAAEVSTREEAEALKGLRLQPPEDEDEFYLADLIGLAAVTPEGAALGRVKAVHDFGAGDILELDPGGGKATVYHPFTRAAVPEVDIAGGRVVCIPPPETADDDEPSPDHGDAGD